MGKRRGKVVFFIVLAGGVIGAILGHILKDIIPILDKGLKVEMCIRDRFCRYGIWNRGSEGYSSPRSQ